jgi:hypothetical protein
MENYRIAKDEIDDAIYYILLTLNNEQDRNQDQDETDRRIELENHVYLTISALVNEISTRYKHSIFRRWIVEVLLECDEINHETFMEQMISNEPVTAEKYLGLFRYHLNLKDLILMQDIAEECNKKTTTGNSFERVLINGDLTRLICDYVDINI